VKVPITVPILSGHRLENEHQIVLGGATLRELHKHVGDTVVVSYGSRKDFPIYVPPTTLRVVGTGTFPAIGTSGSLHTSMGTGALVPKGLEPPAFQAVQNDPDPNNTGPSIVVVNLRSGVPPSRGLASLQRIAAATSKVVNADPNTGGGNYSLLPVQQPAEIVNYKAMGAIPAILASGLAVSAVVALGLSLVASVRRRRLDLALMKTLGFVHRQLSAVVSWQASITAAVGVVLGVPLGITVGRVLWTLFAHAIDAVSEPTVPTLQVVLVASGTLVLANVVALLPGRSAARTPTAVLLRTE
jgi:ABC-type antimicrobial peptide transport system permease subunit